MWKGGKMLEKIYAQLKWRFDVAIGRDILTELTPVQKFIVRVWEQGHIKQVK